MNGELSPNAQAILLLTAPLLVGRSPTSVRPLPLGAYNKLALALADEWGAEAWPDPGTPDALRQIVSSGASLEEARTNLREAVALVIEANREMAREDAAKGAVIRDIP